MKTVFMVIIYTSRIVLAVIFFNLGSKIELGTTKDFLYSLTYFLVGSFELALLLLDIRNEIKDFLKIDIDLKFEKEKDGLDTQETKVE